MRVRWPSLLKHAGAAVVAAALLAACQESSQLPKQLKPVPSELSEKMKQMNMSETGPVFIRIFKESSDPEIVLLLMGAIFIVVGMFMEIIAAGLILIPVLLPVAISVGINPLHFVVYLVTGLSLGLATPPVGTCLFATAQISGIPIERLVRAAMPFYGCSVVIYLLTAIFPEIVLLPIRLLVF
jgi:TRAP-type C4-dicarboxylate transport system permease large subunit